MTDEKIKEEFEKWVPGDATPDEFDFIESINDPSWQCEAVGFYAGFRAAERLAKIEVLEGKISILREVIEHGDNLGYLAYIHDLEREITNLKAVQ